MARKKDTRSESRVAHGRKRSRAGGVRFAITVVATALAVALVSGTGVAAVAVWDVATSAKKTVTLATEPDEIPQIGAIEGGVNFLLVGSDSREGQDPVFGEEDGAVLNDVNMIVHIAADHKSAVVVSTAPMAAVVGRVRLTRLSATAGWPVLCSPWRSSPGSASPTLPLFNSVA